MDEQRSIEPKLREIIGNLVMQVAALQTENEQLKDTIVKLNEEKAEVRDSMTFERLAGKVS